jgi:phosphinothricin acetyltransferase
MDAEIRPGERRDLPGIVAIYNHFVRTSPCTFEVTPVTVDQRAAWFEEHPPSGAHRLMVAVRPGGDVVGWATTSEFRPRAAYATTVESSVYCDPGCLGRGLGTRLYRTLFDSIRDEDLERIVAGVTLPNPPSVALHRRAGFESIGTFTRVGRKFGNFWDVAWFERPLRSTLDSIPARANTRGEGL